MAKTTRYVDAQGRIILPAHIRKALNLTEGHCVEIEIEDGTIRVRPIEERCSICGQPVTGKSYIKAQDKIICKECANAIKYSLFCAEQLEGRE